MRKPEVFLFDEPLSNLDAKLRVQMRLELAKLHADLGTTMIYVTHDQIEAMTLADKIVVLDKGVISQVGSPLELYNAPANKFVAAFIGSPSMNFIPVSIAEVKDEMASIALPGGHNASIRAVSAAAAPGAAELGVRPEHFLDRGAGGSGRRAAGTSLDRGASRQHDDPLCRYARRPARGRRPGRPRREAGRFRRTEDRRAPRASLRGERRGIVSFADPRATRGGGASIFRRQPQHDVLIVVAEAAPEDVDAAGMARVLLHLDPQADRMMGGNVEVVKW